MTSRRLPLLALVWLLGVVVATGIGLLAVRLVAAQVGEPAVPPVTGDVVARPPEASSAPSPSATGVQPSATAAPVVTASRSFRSAGGTVGVECAGRTARLVFATPAEGFALDEQSVAGPEVEVRFEADDTRVRSTVSCASGAPVLVEQRVDD